MNSSNLITLLNKELEKIANSSKYTARFANCTGDIHICVQAGNVQLIIGLFIRVDPHGDLTEITDKFKRLYRRTERYIDSIADSINRLGITETFEDYDTNKVLEVSLSSIKLNKDTRYIAGLKYLDRALKLFADNKLDLLRFYALFPQVDPLHVDVVSFNNTKFAVEDKSSTLIYNLDTLQQVDQESGLFDTILAKYNLLENS